MTNSLASQEPSVSDARRSTIQVLDRAVDVLDAIARRKGIALTPLSKDVGLSLSTTKRIVEALVANGFVERDASTRNFALGTHLRLLVGDSIPRRLVDLARPVLEALSNSTREDVALTALRGRTAVFLDRVFGPQPLKIIEQSDKPVTLNCGFRRLLLAYQSDEWIDNYIRTTVFKRFTPTTIVSKQKLLRSLSQIRKQAYLIAYAEYLVDAAGVSAPVFDAQGTLVAAVVIVGPLSRFRDKARVHAFAGLAVNAARQITSSLSE